MKLRLEITKDILYKKDKPYYSYKITNPERPIGHRIVAMGGVHTLELILETFRRFAEELSN